MQEGPIDVDKYEYATGAQVWMKNAISEEKDTLERDRYIPKQRSSQTIKIICDPSKMNLIYRDLVREPTQEALLDMGRQEELYYGTIIQYLNQYLWKLEDFPPGKKPKYVTCFNDARWNI